MKRAAFLLAVLLSCTTGEAQPPKAKDSGVAVAATTTKKEAVERLTDDEKATLQILTLQAEKAIQALEMGKLRIAMNHNLRDGDSISADGVITRKKNPATDGVDENRRIVRAPAKKP